MNTYLLFVVVHWHDASSVKTTRHNTVIRRIDTRRVKTTRKCLKNFSKDLQNYSVRVTITEDTHPQPHRQSRGNGHAAPRFGHAPTSRIERTEHPMDPPCTRRGIRGVKGLGVRWSSLEDNGHQEVLGYPQTSPLLVSLDRPLLD